jgi:hypothetical protein
MISKQETKISLDQYVGCFGRYRKTDGICRKWCALNLKCAIEHDHNERYEILEELVSANDIVMKVN